MTQIKIKVNKKDRETLAMMFDFAVTASEQCASEFEDLEEHYLKIREKFINLRRRIVFEDSEK